ncbi:MAG: epimerase [Phycisphaerales bacterium]
MNHVPRVVIAGGTGFLGLSLADALHARDYEVVVLSRHRPRATGPWTHAIWDGRTLGAWAAELDGAAAIVNLAGRSVDCIKTPERRDEILRSRVEATNVLGRAVAAAESPPPVWVQMSTAHRYGDPPQLVCDEDSAFGEGLAPAVGAAWEDALDRVAPDPSVCRRVILRTSFVLGRDKGALKRLAGLARIGLGGTVGHGRQGISWIHEADMNRLFVRAIEDASMQGAYIATAPNPVSNREFMRALRRVVGMPIGLPAPALGVALGARWILRTDPELALLGRYCVSRRLRDEGFVFDHPEVGPALDDLYARPAAN